MKLNGVADPQLVPVVTVHLHGVGITIDYAFIALHFDIIPQRIRGGGDGPVIGVDVQAQGPLCFILRIVVVEAFDSGLDPALAHDPDVTRNLNFFVLELLLCRFCERILAGDLGIVRRILNGVQL